MMKSSVRGQAHKDGTVPGVLPLQNTAAGTPGASLAAQPGHRRLELRAGLRWAEGAGKGAGGTNSSGQRVWAQQPIAKL